jgi:transposase
MLQMIRKSIAQTQGLVDELFKRIKEILIKHDNVLELLKEIPGFNNKVVEDLVSEIGLDMAAFPSDKHLASWAGFCPSNNERAGKKAEELLTLTNK